jgi:FtsZ-binding cell division protein ZapB
MGTTELQELIKVLQKENENLKKENEELKKELKASQDAVDNLQYRMEKLDW